MGWTPYVTGALDVYPIPGTHDDMMDAPNVRRVVKRLGEAMAVTRGSDGDQ
jgi:thioesterase domain-containing protein